MKKTKHSEDLVLRVLHFVPGFRSGGIESLLMSLYRCMDKQSIQFDIMVDTNDDLTEFDEIRSAGGRVFQMGRYLDSPLRYQRKIHDILRSHSHEYAALHCHTVIRALPVLLAARWFGITKRVLHSHTDSLKGSKQAIFAPLITSVTVPMATDYWACSEAAGKFYFGRRNFNLFRNTILSDQFKYSKYDRYHIRNKYGINENCLLVGHTGRFTYPKNHDWLIRVFADLKSKHVDAKLLLVGDGPLEADSRNLAVTLGVKDSIHFAGLQLHVEKYLSAMDVFILPSHFEGFGISLLEAQANGLPCLASDVISREVRITSSVTTCNLDADVSTWSILLRELHKKGRIDSTANIELIKRAGYDTEEQLNSLISMYQSF